MAHRLFDWKHDVTATFREYQAVRLALDLFRDAADEEIEGLIEVRGWDERAKDGLNEAERHLDATYLVRMYSVFERAVASYWRQIPDGPFGEPDGKVIVDEVGDHRSIDPRVIASAQEVRAHRNNLVHRRIASHARAMTLEDATVDLGNYLNGLPPTWDSTRPEPRCLATHRPTPGSPRG